MTDVCTLLTGREDDFNRYLLEIMDLFTIGDHFINFSHEIFSLQSIQLSLSECTYPI